MDPIEKCIGRFGKYQTWVFVLLTIGRLPTEFQLTNVVFLLPDVTYLCLENASNATNVCPCANPYYDQSTIVSSVTSTWDLVCGKKYWASLAQSVLQIGILVGSLSYGFLSDRYGRKIAILLAFAFEVLSVAVSAAATKLWMFLVCRFLIGTAVGGTMLCCYVLLIELSGKSFRAYATGLNEIAHIIGYMLLPCIAFYVRDWRHLQLCTSVPWIFVVLYYFLLPESPRWLIAVGRKQEAIQLLTYIANKNNMPVDDIENLVNEFEKETETQKKEDRGNYLDLFRTPKLRVYTLVMAMVWLCTSHTFFGVNQYIGKLHGNLYLNVLLSAVSLAPGLIICVILTQLLKRKISVIIHFCTAAMALVLITFVPEDREAATLALANVGQIGVYNAFVQIYLYACEVFPTVVRNSAMGFSSMFARYGAFIAPFVVNIGVEWISISIFSSLAFFAAVLCCFLPETKKRQLINTIEETENYCDELPNSLEVNLKTLGRIANEASSGNR